MSITITPPTEKFSGSMKSDAILEPLRLLYNYLRSENYEGVDLFDGLNSRLFKSTPFYKIPLCRLAWIQFFKQCPINLRRLVGVPKGFNPKGGALFLMGNLHLYTHTGDTRHAEDAHALYERLRHVAIAREKGVGWGYNFDWQARAFFVPEGTPNLVTSVYVGRALLAYYRRFNNPEALALATGIAHFILNEMVKFETEEKLCFNYIPGKDAEVHNANLLAAAYLAEVFPWLAEDRKNSVQDKIFKAAAFSVSDIEENGAWPYGTKPFHRWVDNFHTAYNIECLIQIRDTFNTRQYDNTLEKVIAYYLNNLFTDDGTPMYFSNKLYPIDCHVIAESLVLAKKLRQSGIAFNRERLDIIESRLFDLVTEFQNPRGYFYHQKLARGWNRIPYIRWDQAWIFYALACQLG